MRMTPIIGWGAAAAATLAARRWQAALRTAQEHAEGLRRERDVAAAATDRAREALRASADRLDRVDRARRAERGFASDLREQLHRVHAAPDADAGDEDSDVRALVLRAAIGLVEADKGLLLSRDDRDRDGDLDLVAAEGFDEDPEHGPVVQRFAREVLARDQIIREDDPGEDSEVDNLVAIPLYIHEQFDGVVVCANRTGGFGDLDDDVLLALGDHAGSALLRDHLEGELHVANRATLRALAEALEARHPVLARESGEVSLLARRIARRLGLDAQAQEQAGNAALVRDVGYLGLPDHLLTFPGALEADERAAIEMHPRVGHALVAKTPALAPVADAILAHHERWDGDGYPHGIEGAAIPLAARIVAVAEAFVAMTHERPFRSARSRQAAMDELVIGTGREFDPDVARACVEELRDEPEGLDPGLSTAFATGDGPGLARDAAPATDPLTLLPGHRAFRDAAEAAGREERGLAVAYVQLDTLGAINRQAGYAAGDDALVAVARAVQRVAARHGATAYRDGGRRFAVLTPSTADDDLREQLHLELADTAAVSTAVANWLPGISVDDFLLRARRQLS